MVQKCRKFVKIRGSFFTIYRDYKGKGVILHKRLVEPEFIRLWYLLSEDKFDSDLYTEITDDNKDFIAFAYGLVYPTGDNRDLNIHTSKRTKYLQSRLVLIEGIIESGNINNELIKELGEILDKLVSSGQIDAKKGARMKKRVIRTYEAVKSTVEQG